jgi:hypothetical protein
VVTHPCQGRKLAGQQDRSQAAQHNIKLADLFSVERVQPRTSKGITDLLLLFLVQLVCCLFLGASGMRHLYGRNHQAKHVTGTPDKSLVRYRNQADKSLHELRTAMHHHPLNQERAINLSILPVFGPGEFSRVESN